MRLVLALVLSLIVGVAHAARTQVTDVRTWSGPEHTRVVLDLSGASDYKMFTLDNPRRVVVDLPEAGIADTAVRSDEVTGVLKDIRTGVRHGRDLRVVLDLDGAAKAKAFTVSPNDTYGHRLVVDLESPSKQAANRKAEREVRRQSERQGDLVIAIDAGHGGEDPGATGAHGTHEKDVVLKVARKLAAILEKTPGFRPVLTRKGDYYIGLRERTRKARAVGADMFVSIHADAVRQRSVRGGSVYILSRRGASGEVARMLARNENAADRIGGVSLDDKDDMVASVLLDLSRAATIEASTGLANTLIGEMDNVGRMHSRDVGKAAFVVLKSLDMPSVLVELAFISNPQEERLLRSASHQQELASALAEGITRYANAHRPRLRMAGSTSQEYVVKRGDTLSEIASNHGVSVSRLRRANEINGDTIVAGTRLRIP
ncbi:N-acetylmuramoyl-L-alanine amidase [Arhodomonas aquaeolei]|uniref:N-acetylmuramoyl-L-alanine amidase n=1 Tax=Arhodomonas aquaeolei TaxID=2369 RepID=UPI000363EBE4|nr:N-acetylmuramoyl-L-alanine amidase [Arhodomonas aquaeolei]